MTEDTSSQTNKIPDSRPSSETGKKEATSVIPPTIKAIPSVMKPVAPTIKKKQTSRIPLEEALDNASENIIKKATSRIPALPSQPNMPQTIRLKRPTTSAQQIGRPAEQAEAIKSGTKRIELSEAPTIAKKQSLKRQTSRVILSTTDRINLQNAPTVTAPKTIRIKRPIGSAEEETKIAPITKDQVETAKKSETVKIDLVSDENESPAVPMTQRKTIKIKRTERNVVPRTIAMARPGVTAAKRSEHVMGQAEKEDADDDDVGMFFSVVAVAAVFVVGALVWLLAAQHLAPNIILPIPSI